MFALLLLVLLFVLGLGGISTKANNPFITVLAYHHIIPEPMAKWENNPMVITLDQFRAEMDYLRDNGYHIASLSEVADFIYDKKMLPEKTVLITFDDSYESTYIYAYPILKEYQFRAAVFVIGNLIPETASPFDPEGLSWTSQPEILEMNASGVMEFGSHTYGAHCLIGGQPALLAMEPADIDNDFKMQSDFFGRHGIPPTIAIAYPYGACNDKIVAAAKKQGYRLGFTTRQGYVYRYSPPMYLSRMSITPGLDLEGFADKLAEGNRIAGR
jgi:peptidoglycan/xylan/chitin deacetylase (PgdA/CDA1 family)